MQSTVATAGLADAGLVILFRYSGIHLLNGLLNCECPHVRALASVGPSPPIVTRVSLQQSRNSCAFRCRNTDFCAAYFCSFAFEGQEAACRARTKQTPQRLIARPFAHRTRPRRWPTCSASGRAETRSSSIAKLDHDNAADEEQVPGTDVEPKTGHHALDGDYGESWKHNTKSEPSTEGQPGEQVNHGNNDKARNVLVDRKIDHRNFAHQTDTMQNS